MLSGDVAKMRNTVLRNSEGDLATSKGYPLVRSSFPSRVQDSVRSDKKSEVVPHVSVLGDAAKGTRSEPEYRTKYSERGSFGDLESDQTTWCCRTEEEGGLFVPRAWRASPEVDMLLEGRQQQEETTKEYHFPSLDRAFQRFLLLLFLRLVILCRPSPWPENERDATDLEGVTDWEEMESTENEPTTSPRRSGKQRVSVNAPTVKPGEKLHDEEIAGNAEEQKQRTTEDEVGKHSRLLRLTKQHEPFTSLLGQGRKEALQQCAREIPGERVHYVSVSGVPYAYGDGGKMYLSSQLDDRRGREHGEAAGSTPKQGVVARAEGRISEDHESETQRQEYLSAWLSFSPPVVRELGEALTGVQACRKWLETLHDSPAHAPLTAILWLRWATWLFNKREQGRRQRRSYDHKRHMDSGQTGRETRRAVDDGKPWTQVKGRPHRQGSADSFRGAAAPLEKQEKPLDGRTAWTWNSFYGEEASGGRSSLWAVAISVSLLVQDREDLLGAASLVEFVLPEAFSLTRKQRRQQTAGQRKQMMQLETKREQHLGAQARHLRTGTYGGGDGEDGTAALTLGNFVLDRHVPHDILQQEETTQEEDLQRVSTTGSLFAHTGSSVPFLSASSSSSSPPSRVPRSAEDLKRESKTKKQEKYDGCQLEAKQPDEGQTRTSVPREEYKMGQAKIQTEETDCGTSVHQEDLDALRFCWFQLCRMQLPAHSMLLSRTHSLFNRKYGRLATWCRRDGSRMEGEMRRNARPKTRAYFPESLETRDPQ